MSDKDFLVYFEQIVQKDKDNKAINHYCPWQQRLRTQVQRQVQGGQGGQIDKELGQDEEA